MVARQHITKINHPAETYDDNNTTTRTINDETLGTVHVIEGEHSMAMSNMPFGGWVQQRDGTLISSVTRAREMNRAQRRKLGIKL